VIRETGFHGGRHSQSLVDAAKIVIRKNSPLPNSGGGISIERGDLSQTSLYFRDPDGNLVEVSK
jgi:catechol 2,3-dioxygenase-like lactoylglutathione lyase family enzyme